MAKHGFDVSSYQKSIVWDKIPDKFSFVIVRAGFGSHPDQIDECFHENVKGALSRGLDVGAYWFLYALSADEARQNAKQFLAAVEPYKGTINYPLFLDVEGDTIRYMTGQGVEASRYLISEMCKAFCEEIERAGYYAAIYSDNNFINNFFTADVLDRYDLWFAYRVTMFNPSYCIRKCGVWQYTNSGTVSGIDGKVDLDYTERDYPAIMRDYNLNFVNGEPENVDVPVSNTLIESGTVSENEKQIFIVLNKKVAK